MGSRIPPIAARDMAGKPVTVRDLSDKNGVVLVFFRSAKWCPYCQKQLIELKDAKAPWPSAATGWWPSATIRPRS
uniref:Redoxin domain-containing protein n=1 Tax=Phenylobacterium glaciei TaxID=2803784 RepID=A0A974P353_9CAUL|nr:redoxin domain-containing protein [Phenylobacterium glaciei]